MSIDAFRCWAIRQTKAVPVSRQRREVTTADMNAPGSLDTGAEANRHLPTDLRPHSISYSTSLLPSSACPLVFSCHRPATLSSHQPAQKDEISQPRRLRGTFYQYYVTAATSGRSRSVVSDSTGLLTQRLFEAAVHRLRTNICNASTDTPSLRVFRYA